jgi:hypothetical protein
MDLIRVGNVQEGVVVAINNQSNLVLVIQRFELSLEFLKAY